MLLGLGTGTSRADSILDRHGPDGLAFSGDDPLRVGAGVHRGAFFLAYNAVNAMRPGAPFVDLTDGTGVQQVPNPVQLGYINMSDMSVSLMNMIPTGTWSAPKKVAKGGSTSDRFPDIWTNNPNDDFYYGGDSLRHLIPGVSKDDCAVRLDPSWVKGLPDNFLIKIEEIRFGTIAIDRCHVTGVMQLAGAYPERLSGSFAVRVERVWVKYSALFGLISGWKEVGGVPIGSSNLPPEMSQAIQDKINSNPSLATSGITPAQIVAAANNPTSTCASVKPGLDSSSPECAAINALLAQTRSEVGEANDLNAQAGIVQDAIDLLCEFERALIPDYDRASNWLKWKSVTGGASAARDGLAEQVMGQNTLANKFREWIPPAQVGSPKAFASAHMFNSLYLYGPKGKWLLNRRGEQGLVENFVYARLSRINPNENVTLAGGRPGAKWELLDMITEKPAGTVPPPLPWPPTLTTPTGMPADGRAKVEQAFGNGAGQVVGDECAVGTWDNPSKPQSFGQMIVVVNPDEYASPPVLHAAFYARSIVEGAGAKEVGWVPVVPPGAPDPALPPNYAATTGQTSRRFNATLGNSEPMGNSFFHYWDFEGDGTLDSYSAQMVARFTPQQEVIARCYMESPDTGWTGMGSTPVKP